MSTTLNQLNNLHVRQLRVKIILLNFQEEKIREITGICSQGNININGSSSLRRTLNLTMTALLEENNLENLDNLISLNKKIRVEIGIKMQDEEESWEWYPQGIFIISQASINSGVSGSSITIQAKDKMCKLNGIAGGTFPATIIFHEYEKIHEDGSVTLEQPTIYEIIREAVHEYGEEPYHNIKICDLDIMGNQAVAYKGSKKYIAFRDGYSEYQETDEELKDYPIVYKKGETIGYQLTPLIYPGSLQMAAGATVTALLDKIVQVLGNYEYFYNIQGEFIFQKKKNYLNNNIFSLEELISSNYIQLYPESWFSEIFNNEEGLISVNNSPKYENIKNDYIVWGQKTLGTGEKTLIRYHLAIDKKPELNYALCYMYKEKNISSVNYYFYPNPAEEKHLELVGRPCDEWREELYRMALVRQAQGDTSAYYDEELLAEWPAIYSTLGEWSYQRSDGLWEGWNYKKLNEPNLLNYWIDFLDTKAELQGYGVNTIGRRTVAINKQECDSLFPYTIPNLYFFNKPKTFEEKQKILDMQKSNGFDFLFVSEAFSNASLSVANGASSAYDYIKELLCQNLIYNTNITITCMPMYHLEPNNLIYINSEKTATFGRFVINQLTIPLTYNGTMSIQASQAMTQI